MNVKKLLTPYPLPLIPSFSLLFVRLIMGSAFILHGLPKIQAPFNWAGPDAAIPGFLLFLAAVSEFFGGIGLILGFLTPLVSLGLICTMGFATYFHAVINGDPFVGQGVSYELALVYLGLSVMFLIIGPGMHSVDRALFKK